MLKIVKLTDNVLFELIKEYGKTDIMKTFNVHVDIVSTILKTHHNHENKLIQITTEINADIFVKQKEYSNVLFNSLNVDISELNELSMLFLTALILENASPEQMTMLVQQNAYLMQTILTIVEGGEDYKYAAMFIYKNLYPESFLIISDINTALNKNEILNNITVYVK